MNFLHNIFVLLKRDRRGSIVIYASAILLVMLASAVSYATVGLSQIRQADIIDNSMEAFYASETGIERALDELKHIKATSQLLTEYPTSDNLWDDDFLADYGAGVTAKTDITELEVEIPKIVKFEFTFADRPLQIDLFDPLIMVGTIQDVRSIGYRWDIIGDDDEFIELGIIDVVNSNISESVQLEYALAESGIWKCLNIHGDITGDDHLFEQADLDAWFPAEDCEPSADVDCLPKSGDTPHQYRLRAKGVGNDLNNLEIAVSTAGCIDNLPASIDFDLDETAGQLHVLGGVAMIDTTGSSRKTTQSFRAIVPVKKSTPGLWDFTIFINKPLDK